MLLSPRSIAVGHRVVLYIPQFPGGSLRPVRVIRETEACSLSPDDSVLGGTSRQSNTHSSEVREIRYPWHPWYGRAVCIHGALVKGGQALYHCSLEQNHQAPLFQIPQWMFESGACCRMHRAEEPAVDCAALRDLRRLLHHTRSRSVRKSDRSVLGSPRVVSAARPMCKCIQFGCRSIPAR